MTYLFFQTLIWLLAAFLLGVFVGWLIWRKTAANAQLELDSANRALEECRLKCSQLEIQHVQHDDNAGTVATAASTTGAAVSMMADDVMGNSVGVDEVAAEAAAEVVVSDEWKPEFLSSPQGTADDLKRIKGIGPVIEKTLNDLGVFHFWQIADFNADNIKWVNHYIDFPGRIEREDWVGQAKEFANS